jgi:hypothetical protein
MKLVNPMAEQLPDTDQFIRHFGLDPVAVRDAAINDHSSIAEVICKMIGIEPREFVRLLKERANLAR